MSTRKKRAGMTDEALAALCNAHIDGSVDLDRADLRAFREKALKYYDGEESLGGDTPVQAGRSKVVSRDLSDTHGWVMPGLLRVFLGSDRVAVYEPRRREAEAGARQATDTINHVFLSECSGYKVLHDALWNGLTFGNGPIKHWWDDTPVYTTERFRGLDEARFIQIVTADDTEDVLEHSSRPDPSFSFAAAQPAAALLAAGAAAARPAAPDGGDAAGPGGGSADAPPAGPEADAATGDPLPRLAGPLAPPLASPLHELKIPLLHDLKIKRLVSRGRLCIKAVPPEEFGLGVGATALTEDECGGFVRHTYRELRSKLIERGYDKAKVEGLPAFAGATSDDAEKDARDSRITEIMARTRAGTAGDRSTDEIEVHECYVLCDYEGTGVAGWRQVVMAGGTAKRHILSNEEWGGLLPFSDIVPSPMPHRWRGRSLFEEVEDIQRSKTVKMRAFNDNMYAQGNPQREVLEGAVVNMDELTAPTFNGVIIVKQPGAIREVPVPFVGDKLLMGIEKDDQVKEFRTGVSAGTMALDPEALSHQTATAVHAQQTAAYSKTETYARNVSEYEGLKRLFRCLLRLIVENQDKARTIRLRGEWVEMDPRGWDADMDVVINTGLGSGSRDRDAMALNQVLVVQEKMALQLAPVLGIDNDVCGIRHITDTARKLAECLGLKSPETYIGEVTDPVRRAIVEAMQAQAPAGDPEAMKAQAQAALEGQKIQAQAQLEQAKFQWQQQADIHRLQIAAQRDAEKAQLEADLERYKAERAAEREAAQAQADIAVKERETAFALRAKEQEQAFTMQLETAKFAFAKELEILKAHLTAQNGARAHEAQTHEAQAHEAQAQERREAAAAQADETA